MNVEHKDFIGVYRDVFPEGYCSHLIQQFDFLEVSGAGRNRKQSESAPAHKKDDYQVLLNYKNHNIENFNNAPVVNMFFEGLQKCYENYAQKFSILQESKISAHIMKMQRTAPGGGYHLWHSEQDSGDFAARVMVYMLYLNTLSPEEAGETEFLYQQTRIAPQENTMILWPAAFTHTHRGNTVFGNNSKYIVTGWFYYD